MKLNDAIVVRAGERARSIISQDGLQAGNVSTVVAAAGGPKGLALMPMDRWLADEFLGTPSALGPRLLVGASIGAWRMAALASEAPKHAIDELTKRYIDQRYSERPSPVEVSERCRSIVSPLAAQRPRSDVRLGVITVRSVGLLSQRHSMGRFAAAAAANFLARAELRNFFHRTVFTHGDVSPLVDDPMGWTGVELTPANAEAALLASGTLPLLANPVSDPSGAPEGLYWDGGLVDYHVVWDWSRQPGLVLYPHFVDHLVPGWLDKSLRWRRAKGDLLSNVVLVSPSQAFLQSLPLKRLPNRDDFYRFGQDHEARIRVWQQTVAHCTALAEAFAGFVDGRLHFPVGSL